METKFQTSFIPKKSLTPMSAVNVAPRQHNFSIFMMIAVLLFLASLAGIGGAFAWKQYLLSSQESYKKGIHERQQRFTLNEIELYRLINTKIDSAKTLLDNHVAFSEIFDILGVFTVERVRFMNLDLVAPTNPNEPAKISMKGYGVNLKTIAFQSLVLNRLEDLKLRQVVKNPMMTDPVIMENNLASFDFSASIDTASMKYKQLVTPSTEGAVVPPNNTQPN